MAEKGGHTDVVKATPKEIFEALLDFESYPEWQAGVLETKVLERDEQGRGSLIEMYVDAKIRKVRFTVRYHYDEPAGLGWDFVSGDLKDNQGRYTFVPVDDDTTETTCDIEFEIGFYVPGPMKNLIKDQSLKNSMRDLKKRVQK
jgi:ribosome-associated toxin RatA of RatAB toxin-antitoxin module